MRGTTTPKILLGLAGLAVLAASCGYGETFEADQVTGGSARLRGEARTTLEGPITYYFEYGPTDAYGWSTDVESAELASKDDALLVSTTVTGLSEGTDYHYRLCVDASDGVGSCGDDMIVTTTWGMDAVVGSGFLLDTPAVGIDADAHSGGDGSSPYGSVYVHLGDATEGWVWCLNVIENRAAIGFENEEGDLSVAYVEDNGASGDRLSVQPYVGEGCPYPDEDKFTPLNLGGILVLGPEIVSGDFIVFDGNPPL